jgi:dTDP-4-dehydrorhamnose reductase
MELPRVLLIGKVGQVGWELRRILAPMADLTCIDYPEIDLSAPDSIRDWTRRAAPKIIVNSAAYTAVDKAESESERANQINGHAPGILAEAAASTGALLVHFSTDYVFDGAKKTPYIETDAPNPLGAYGRSKLLGDEAVRATGCRHLIFRLCWVYGARGQNFMLTMMRLAREREILRVVSDQVGCPTWSRLIAQAVAYAIQQWQNAADQDAFTGTYNLAAGGSTSWHGFASAIIDSIPAKEKKCSRVDPITTEQYPTPARRPAYSVLDCSKLAATFGLRLPGWREGLSLVQEQ